MRKLIEHQNQLFSSSCEVTINIDQFVDYKESLFDSGKYIYDKSYERVT